MSHPPPPKLNEARGKKFQSLNINNIYQGAANKNTSKGPPPKHGLQSLGKVPTARRAPANLPSVKAEKGNDPRVLLVPTGGSGWTKDGEKPAPVQKGEISVSKPETKEPVAPVAPTTKPSGGVKSWSSVTGASQQGRAQTFGHQKSPLFGQEFPSLRVGEGGVPLPEGEDPKSQSQGANRLQLESQPGKEDLLDRNNYGPGPNLRPQTFGNWTQGGTKVPGGPHADSQLDTGPIIPPQPHKPVPPGSSAQFTTKSPSNQSSSSNQYKSIMPPFMDAMELPAGPPEGMGGGRRISRPGQQQRDRREPPQRSRPNTTTTTEFAPPSIIDTEKLRRMDDITGGDDWTFDDDNFDYNKRLQSDDEDVETESSRTDPNWADQVEKTSQPYNFYEDMKKPVGFGLEEEEKRRTKKSDEVMKNIERARQRREEEENRYRRPGSEEPYKEERGGGRRFEEGVKENKTPSVERKEWGYEETRHKQPRSFDDRRDERGERSEQQRREGGGYYPQRFGATEDKPRKEEHSRNDIHFEDDYSKAYGRKEQRSFDDRNRSSEDGQAFADFVNTDDSRSDSRWTGKSPVYNRQNSQLSTSESPEVELENGTSEWGRPVKGMSDWVEEVENTEFVDRYDPEVDQTSRPNSRDSRISRDSRGSKDGKGSRSSVEKTKKLPEFEEEKPGRLDNPIPEQYDVERKQQHQQQSLHQQPLHQQQLHQQQSLHQAKKPAPVGQDLRGYFRDAPLEPKKVARAAPGPITREKLEASDNRETNSMTQLKKLDSKPESKPEAAEKLNPLIDSDMLENISDDEDDLLDTLEREDKSNSQGGRGRGRGRGLVADQRKPISRGGRGGERGAGQRGARGGRGEYRGRGNHGRYMDQEGMEESEDMRNSRKGFDKFPDKQGPPPPIGFMPRGQPSRRGRGDGKSNRATFGRGGMNRYPMETEDHNEDVGDWNEDEMTKGRGGKIPPRMQKKREERRKMEGEEIEEWETASEHSNEEREKRKREMERGRGRGRGWDMRGGRGRGVGHPNDMREPTPEHDSLKKRSGIENIDLHDFASVVVVDQESGQHELEVEQGDAGEFMQVVNRKPRPINGRDDRKVFDRSAPKVSERGGYDPRYRDTRDNRDNFNKPNKTYERRQNKLPPRLAKVREVSRAQARSGGVSPSGMEQNGWPEGDKMGVFQVEDLGTTAWEKPPPPRREKEGSEGPDMRASPKAGKENGGIQQTMVFENTALKGGKGEKMDKTGIQLPVCLGKPEDNLDVKLDFTFGGDDLSGQVKSQQLRSMPHLSSSQGLPASPSTDDLSAKLANTKKLWDSPGMAAVPENSAATSSSWNDGTTFSENPGFESFQDSGNQGVENQGGYDKVDNVNNQANVAAKVKQQQQHLALDQDNRPNNNMQYNRMTNNTIPGAIPSPPTQMNQMGTMQPQPWAYPLDRNSTMYNPYGASQLNQSILMQGTHSIGTELFSGSNGAGGYRLQNTGHYPGSQQSTTNNVLISQANLISTGVKHSNQIGPIGTKAGTGANTSPYLQSGLGTLPNTFIQYDASNFNYVNPNAAGLQRGNAPPTQTAFYQTLASRQPQLAALNAMPGTYNHALSQQQMRANHVAGLPFMKNDMSGLGNQKSPLGDNFGTGPSYNGRPSSPKTKQQQQQQQHHQQQAKLAAAGINNMNQLAQLRMSSLGYGMGIPGVQPGYPSPIARPQVNHGNPGNQGGHGMPGKVDYYTQDGGGGEDKAEKDLDKGVESKDSEAPEHDQGDQESGEAS